MALEHIIFTTRSYAPRRIGTHDAPASNATTPRQHTPDASTTCAPARHFNTHDRSLRA
jgi:hypothetical protein